MAAGPNSIQRMKEASIGRLWLGGEEVNAVDDSINLINGITATAGEINTLTGVVAGTTAASSALVVDATKNLDTLSITSLKLGAAGGTAVTSTAAELNELHSVTPGTAAASKVAVLGANKNLDTLVLAAGGLFIGSGAGTAVSSVAADLNLVSGMVAAAAGIKKVAKVALSGAGIHAAVTNWQNPESGSIIINRITVDVTTIATAAATLSTGTTAVSATTASANLIDTVDVHSSTGVFDNVQDHGTLGKAVQKLATGKWVTFKEQSGDITGLVGNAYIEYELV